MLSYPKISIVTPSFNQGKYIEQTILSVLNQEYPNLEYIIIDGGSTDNTVEIIKKYENRITYWVSEKDKGQSDALNKGLARCTGDIFNWINSDDYFAPNTFKEVADFFIKYKTLKCVCGQSSIFDDPTGEVIFSNRTSAFSTIPETMVNGSFNQQGMFYSTDVVKDLGGINTSLNYVMDLELWFRFLQKYGLSDVRFTTRNWGYFRLHTTSKTTAFIDQFRQEEFGIINYLIKEKAPETLLGFFKGKRYHPLKSWSLSNTDSFINELCFKYFFEIYKGGHKSLISDAFLKMIRAKEFNWNWLFLRIFIKTFLYDFKFNALRSKV